jgi:hypothetical protein
MLRVFWLLVVLFLVGCNTQTTIPSHPKEDQEEKKYKAAVQSIEDSGKAKTKTEKVASFWPIVLENSKDKTVTHNDGSPIVLTWKTAKNPYEWSIAKGERDVDPKNVKSTFPIEVWSFLFDVPWGPLRDIKTNYLSETGKGTTEFLEWECLHSDTEQTKTIEFRFRLLQTPKL